MASLSAALPQRAVLVALLPRGFLNVYAAALRSGRYTFVLKCIKESRSASSLGIEYFLIE